MTLSNTSKKAYHRLAREWLACADALRTARSQLYRLVAAGEPSVLGKSETVVTLCDGLAVATALEILAPSIVEKLPMPRKKIDPRRAALEEKAAKLQTECERHYARMKRAFNAAFSFSSNLSRACGA
jgi:hypothetical protein